MNRLSAEKRAAILRSLVAGCSIRATARMTGTAKGTVLKLLVDVGQFCSIYQDHVFRGLPCERIEADEIWAFVGGKERNATRDDQGDSWTFTAIDPDSKLMLTWYVGLRTAETRTDFMHDLVMRMAGRIQITTDGHGMYVGAIKSAFEHRVHCAQIVLQYGQLEDPDRQRRYSPPVITGTMKIHTVGRPDFDRVSTSYVERSNLHLRMRSRRFTRLTNAFSKKIENHAHAVSLHFMNYNFCQPHGTLTKREGRKTTPAMAVGLTDRVWMVEDILALVDAEQPLC